MDRKRVQMIKLKGSDNHKEREPLFRLSINSIKIKFVRNKRKGKKFLSNES